MTHRGPFQPLLFCDSVLQHGLPMGSQPPSGIPLLQCGVLHGLQVEICSTRDFHGLQVEISSTVDLHGTVAQPAGPNTVLLFPYMSLERRGNPYFLT